MRDFVAEIAFYAAVCVIGAVFIFIWRTQPVLAVLAISVFAIAAGWIGYDYRRFVDPESSRLRRFRAAAAVAGLAAFGAVALWASLCSCI